MLNHCPSIELTLQKQSIPKASREGSKAKSHDGHDYCASVLNVVQQRYPLGLPALCACHSLLLLPCVLVAHSCYCPVCMSLTPATALCVQVIVHVDGAQASTSTVTT